MFTHTLKIIYNTYYISGYLFEILYILDTLIYL